MEIRAALTHAPDAPFSIESVELDAPRDDEILVRIVAAGICHTDLTVKASWPAESGPIVLGHEGAGVVEAVGGAVQSVAPGDPVLLSYRSCRACRACVEGMTPYCDEFRTLNAIGVRPDGSTTMHRNGTAVHASFFGQSSFATHALAYESNVVKVGPHVDLTLAAPLGCGIQTGAGAVMNVLKPGPGSSLVVFGAGGVGLAAVMAGVHLDLAAVIAVDPVEARREIARELGATHALDPTAGNVVEHVRDLTGGGAGAAFDTTGIPGVMADAVQAVGRLGAVGLVGTGVSEMTLDVKDVIRAGKSVRGIMEGDADPLVFLPELLELMRDGRLPLERIVRRYPFDAINEAVGDARSGATIKPVLTF